MLQTLNKSKNMRLIHLDLLRIIAIYLVAFNHTSNRGYMLFANETETAMHFPYMMFSAFCKIAVPIFFMISGALLLPRQESLKQLFKKRILRMAVVLLLISIPYYYVFLRSKGISILNFLTYIYGNSATTSLWYLYSYIGLLFMLPFLRNMVKQMKHNDFIYLFIGYFVFTGVLPCLEYCLWGGNVTLNEDFSSVLFVTQNVFFALMGYYLEHVIDIKKFDKKVVFISIVLSIISIIITCLITNYRVSREGGCNTEQLEGFFNCFICIPAITVYLLIKSLGSKISGHKIQRVLSTFGSAVFGVYLIEKFCRILTGSVYSMLLPLVGSFISSLVWCLATCCIAFLVIISLKNIPILKNIVNKFI